MRLLTYNIAYGTGCPKDSAANILTAHRYLRSGKRPFKKICQFITAHRPDLVALVEVDTGSIRNNYTNQAEQIAEQLNSYSTAEIKYSRHSIGRRIPILRKQANAILSRDPDAVSTLHYFPVGFKRLVLELQTGRLHVFLVHLALNPLARKRQIRELEGFLPKDEPVILTGDFNTMRGVRELETLCGHFSLKSANVENLPTYPSWEPEKQLDFILYSRSVHPKRFLIPKIRHSDHLPLIFDFDLD